MASPPTISPRKLQLNIKTQEWRFWEEKGHWIEGEDLRKGAEHFYEDASSNHRDPILSTCNIYQQGSDYWKSVVVKREFPINFKTHICKVQNFSFDLSSIIFLEPHTKSTKESVTTKNSELNPKTPSGLGVVLFDHDGRNERGSDAVITEEGSERWGMWRERTIDRQRRSWAASWGGGRQGELVNTSRLEGIKFRSYFPPLDFDPMVNIKSSSEMKPELALYIYSCMFPRKEALVKN